MPPSREAIRILFVAANPLDSGRLQLDEEVRQIEGKIRYGPGIDRLVLEVRGAARPDDLIDALQEIRPNILHFSGHGEPNGSLLLQGNDGMQAPVSPEALANYLRACVGAGDPLHLVVLNACWSLALARPLAEVVGMTIGMTRPIADSAAIAFGASFYQALAHGRSYEDSFEMARASLGIKNQPDAANPRIVLRAGSTADQERPRSTPSPLPDPVVTPATFEPATPTKVQPARWRELAPKPPPLPEGKNWHVFLSYRSADRRWTISLYDTLKTLGFEAFLDQACLPAGSKIHDMLAAALDASLAGALIWSTRTADSEWIKDEYSVMAQRNRQDPGFAFVPITIDGTSLPSSVNTHHHVDFAEYPEGPSGGGLLHFLYGLAAEPMSPEAVAYANELNEQARTARHSIEAHAQADAPQGLIALLDSHEEVWSATPTLSCLVAEKLIGMERVSEALVVLDRLMTSFPNATRPKQMKALALKRRNEPGDLSEAIVLLSALHAAGEIDSETKGILGSCWMMRYKEDSRKIGFLRKSRDLYLSAFRDHPSDSYVGINAAAKSALLDEMDLARTLAEEVLSLVGTEISGEMTDYWTAATIPEAHLILGNFEAATQNYQHALSLDPHATGNHQVTKVQAMKLLEVLPVRPSVRSELIAAFK